jgi:hypothetical protein
MFFRSGVFAKCEGGYLDDEYHLEYVHMLNVMA